MTDISIGTWCEGCGPHENLGVCSECGYPIEVGVAANGHVYIRADVLHEWMQGQDGPTIWALRSFVDGLTGKDT